MIDRFIMFAVYAVGIIMLLPRLALAVFYVAVFWVLLRFIFQVTSILLA